MNVLRSVTVPLTWPRTALLMIIGIVCFHAAYWLTPFGPLHLAIIGYVICLVQLARLKTTRQSFYTGLITALLSVAPQLGFLWRIFGPAAIALWIILALWIAAFTGMISASLRRFGPVPTAILVPFVWMGLEYFRSELYYLKFSWMNVGYAFSGWNIFPFHIFGMYGVGFVAASCAALFLVFRQLYATFATIVLIVAIAFLVPELGTIRHPARIRIAGVQMEFPSEREIPAALDLLFAKYPNADIFVLSEYTLTGPVPASLKDWCRNHQRYLVVGGEGPAPNNNYYDTAFVVGPDGEIVFRQGKSVPIQFFKDGLPAPKQEVWNSPWGKIGFCVCYDLSYTRVTDPLVKKGAQLLIVPTMDVVDWGEHQHRLHALVAPVRAEEYHVPIFRLASSGISQAVAADGRVLATAPFQGEGKDLFATLDLSDRTSIPLDRYLAPIAVCITGVVLVLLCLVKRGTKPIAPNSATNETTASSKDSSERLQLRIQGDASQPTLIYLPGLHGDWTLISSFKRALGNRVRFVETTYPRTLTWSLEDYAENVENALAEKGITRGWLLGESFSSQVVWPLLARGRLQVEGVILAGGFVRHPIRAAVRLAERRARGISLPLLTRIMFGYAKFARFRYRHSPETMKNIHEFIERRTELDRQAAVHRLRLIAGSDFCEIVQKTKTPIFGITGVLDPIVPWMFVRPWLRRNCPALRDYKIMWRADHNVLSTAAEASAEQIVRWMNETRSAIPNKWQPT